MKSKQYILGIDPKGAEAPDRVLDRYTGLYYIYYDGRIQNINTGKFLSPSSPNDYLRVRLCKPGKSFRKKVHRLIAEHHIPNPNNYPCVNHKDGNKQNNHADNLEWCTHKHNSKHAVRMGLHSNKRPKITRKCDGCSITISFDPCELGYYTYKFCSKSCYHKNQGWVQRKLNKRSSEV